MLLSYSTWTGRLNFTTAQTLMINARRRILRVGASPSSAYAYSTAKYVFQRALSDAAANILPRTLSLSQDVPDSAILFGPREIYDSAHKTEKVLSIPYDKILSLPHQIRSSGSC